MGGKTGISLSTNANSQYENSETQVLVFLPHIFTIYYLNNFDYNCIIILILSFAYIMVLSGIPYCYNSDELGSLRVTCTPRDSRIVD